MLPCVSTIYQTPSGSGKQRERDVDASTSDSSYKPPARGSNPQRQKSQNLLLPCCCHPKREPSTDPSSRNIPPMLLTAEPPASMENSSNVQPGLPPRSRMTPRKEKESRVTVAPRSHRQRPSKVGRAPEASSGRKERQQKEKPETNDMKLEQETEVKVRSTVVDIDSVRDNEVKEENLGLLEAAEQDGLKRKSLGVFEWMLMVFVLAVVLLLFPLSIWFCVKVVREHERAVVFRLGHLLRGRPQGPGLLFYLPFLDVCHKVDIRLKMLKVPLHTVVTKDMVRPELSAVCYYQIENVALCSTALSSLTTVLQTLVQAAVRDILAQHTFSHILLHRRRIGQQIQAAVDSVACHWGIRVERADIDELSFPVELQQSLAAEAEAKRQHQVRVKATEAERDAWEGFRASLRLLHPALVLPLNPDLLSVTPDLSSLPPPPPPAVEGEGGTTEGEPDTDSPMM
ncbi:podocin isoform X3 [Epinephelus moara]|uniref:podocin isoform X3 n=1 Tax=Epinephelus moara TaxID=300413 RepID=UPI00214EBA7B|nr:podocin isoform X3 [Epinephelus moara]